jgi:hypothetical protein
MLSAIGPIGPVSSGGGGSWVWALVAVGVVVAFLVVTWFVGLWGSSSGTGEGSSESSSYLESTRPEKKAA